jgi:hypothetical protein
VFKTGGYVAIGFGVFMGIGVVASGKYGPGGLPLALFVFAIAPIAVGVLLVTIGRSRR